MKILMNEQSNLMLLWRSNIIIICSLEHKMEDMMLQTKLFRWKMTMEIMEMKVGMQMMTQIMAKMGGPGDEGDPLWHYEDEYYTKAEVDELLSQAKIEMIDSIFGQMVDALAPILQQIGERQQYLEAELAEMKQMMPLWPQQRPPAVLRPHFEAQPQPVGASVMNVGGLKVEMTPEKENHQFWSQATGPDVVSGGPYWMAGSSGGAVPVMMSNDGPAVTIAALGKGGGGHQGHQATPKQTMMGGVFPPSLYALQHHVEAPYLDPRKKDSWTFFEKNWEEWSKYQLYGVPDGPVGDVMRRDLLLTRLHPILKEGLRGKIAARPDTSSQDVMEYLRKYFSVDDPH